MIEATYRLSVLAIKSKLIDAGWHRSFLNNDRMNLRWFKLNLAYNVRRRKSSSVVMISTELYLL
jgi:hypothetical protein